MFQITPETLITMATSAAAGAITAFFGNKIVNQEIWDAVRQAAKEVEALRKQLTDSSAMYHADHRDLEARREALIERVALLEIDSAICKHTRRRNARLHDRDEEDS